MSENFQLWFCAGILAYVIGFIKKLNIVKGYNFIITILGGGISLWVIIWTKSQDVQDYEEEQHKIKQNIIKENENLFYKKKNEKQFDLEAKIKNQKLEIQKLEEMVKYHLIWERFNSYSFDNKTIDKMSGIDFENFIGKLFHFMGADVQKTKSTNDQGVDLIISGGGIPKTAVQIKRYSNPVGNTAIQEVIAGMYFYKCDEAIVITNSTFTSSAKNLAKTFPKLGLFDGQELNDLIEQFMPRNSNIPEFNYNEAKKINSDLIKFPLKTEVDIYMKSKLPHLHWRRGQLLEKLELMKVEVDNLNKTKYVRDFIWPH